MLNKYEKKAIELKYNGYTYGEMSKTMGNKIASGTLRNWFSHGGKLHVPYLQFVEQMDQITTDDVVKEFKRDAARAPVMFRSLYQLAVKAKDYTLAYRIACEQLDRAGIVTVHKVETKQTYKAPEKQLTMEQLYEQLRQQGVDPLTGIAVKRIAAPQSN